MGPTPCKGLSADAPAKSLTRLSMGPSPPARAFPPMRLPSRRRGLLRVLPSVMGPTPGKGLAADAITKSMTRYLLGPTRCCVQCTTQAKSPAPAETEASLHELGRTWTQHWAPSSLQRKLLQTMGSRTRKG